MRSQAADALAGTYVVEDRGRQIYDIIAVGSPRSPGPPSDRHRRPGKPSDRLKHTELPALSSLDELLARTRCMSELDTGQVPAQACTRLPPIKAEAVCLHHQRTSDFKEWLRAPRGRLGRRNSEEEKRGPPSWHLWLLRASYKDRSLEVATVAEWLAEVLAIAPEAALACAEAAKLRSVVHLATFDAWHEVAEKAESLRGLGLATQVSASVSSKRGEAAGRKAKASYMDIFAGLALAARKKKRRPQMPAGSRVDQHRRVGRGLSNRLVVDVVSQDPVKAILKEDEEDHGEVSPESPDRESEAERSSWDAARRRKRQLKQMLLRYKQSMDQAKTPVEEPAVVNVASTRSRPDPPARSGSKSQVERAVRLTAHRKEACQMMRFFVFGNAGLTSKREAFVPESVGTRAQVEALSKMWMKLDQDHSGRCDFGEFRPFAEARMADLIKALPDAPIPPQDLPTWAVLQSQEDVPRIVSRFLKTLEQVLLGIKSSFVLEDIMRVLWPAAQLSDLSEMRRWGTEHAKTLDRTIVSTPPLLPEANLEDLQCVFKYFDKDNDRQLKAEEILASGLLNPSEVQLLMEHYDADGDGLLGMLEFCEMLCPQGFRAHEQATRASLSDGTNVVYDPTIHSWRITSLS
mmetsp:Transcript_49847/g.116300  ORF Transcript_49847/g.116300 Transcript_49847/m.116300 type:complete len:632 (-) Transcript_49847:61-1956(-)